jgi:hypothetical protein
LPPLVRGFDGESFGSLQAWPFACCLNEWVDAPSPLWQEAVFDMRMGVPADKAASRDSRCNPEALDHVAAWVAARTT